MTDNNKEHIIQENKEITNLGDLLEKIKITNKKEINIIKKEINVVKKEIIIIKKEINIVKKEENNYIQLLTEDLGKQFEKAICLVYEIDYVGPYKYGLEVPEKLKPRLEKIKNYFPQCKHTAEKGNPYDFTSDDENKKYLSAKTTKKGGKVAPQIIGQASPKILCEIFKLGTKTDIELKEWIISNIKIFLKKCESHTFDCPILYYNQKKNIIKYIEKKSNINWNDATFQFTHILKNKEWNNSTTVQIKIDDFFVSIAEIQFHNKRKNTATRWYFEKILEIFSTNFVIVDF